MGQIIGGAAKPKRCNISQMSNTGTGGCANLVLDAGEYMLVSSDNSMTAAGQGGFDCCIEGDGTKAVKDLILKGGDLDEYVTIEANRSYINLDYAVGDRCTYTKEGGAPYGCIVMDVSEGEVIILSTRGNTVKGKSYAFMDNNDIVLSLHQASAVHERVVVPQNAAKMVVNSYVTTFTPYILVKNGKLLNIEKSLQGADEEPTRNSGNLLKSGGTFNVIQGIKRAIYDTYSEIELVNESVGTSNQLYELTTPFEVKNGDKIAFEVENLSISDNGTLTMYLWQGSTSISSGQTMTVIAPKTFTINRDAVCDKISFRATVACSVTLKMSHFLSNGLEAEVNGIIKEGNLSEGYRFDNTGALVKEDGYVISDKIPVAENDVIVWHYSTKPAPVGLCVYREDGTRIINYWGMNAVATRTFTMPAESSYIIASFEENVHTLSINGVDYPLAIKGAIPVLNKKISELEKLAGDNVVSRNKDKLPALYNSCRWHKESTTFKDFCALIATDVHTYWLGNNNAIEAANNFNMIDCYINCGDTAGSYYAGTQATAFAAALANLTKPAYLVIGNHDVGNCFYVGYSCNHEQAYTAWIKPMVDNGWLSMGEYEAGKPYWYHDDSTRKIRLIGLYEYDDALDLNETYWRAITYDSSLGNVAFSTSYTQGQKVNVSGYTAYSFEAVQAVTTPVNYYTTPEKLPSYKVRRGYRVIRQTQAQWFLDALASTPADYGVVVILHNPFSDNATSYDCRFTYPVGVLGSAYSQNDMATDFIRNAVVAFKNKTNYSEKVAMKGNAAYLNTLSSGGLSYAYEVSKNFSTLNSGVHLLGLLGGHSHRDIVWKDATENIFQITPNCVIVDSANDRSGDVRRTTEDGLCADSLTVVSFASGRIGLVKIGVNMTEHGVKRDYEVIPVSE